MRRVTLGDKSPKNTAKHNKQTAQQKNARKSSETAAAAAPKK